MSEDKKAARLNEINQYISILARDTILSALPEETVAELHRVLGDAVSLVQHMEEGED